MTERKKPSVAFWATVAVVVVLVAYPLSCGPAAWLRAYVLPKSTRKALDTFYWPLGIINRYIPGASTLSLRYICLWVKFEDLVKTSTDQ